MVNTLYYGDNLDILRHEIDDNSVDLIYLDPPFNSKSNYNLFFRSPSGQLAQAQRHAFDDTWKWEQAASAYHQVLASGGEIARILEAIHSFLGPSDVLSYLAMMTVRLTHLHRVLKSTGSLYLHCDPTASHYLKVILDGVFAGRFRNEIIWQRTSAHNDPRGYGRVHDVILFFTKGKTYTWNQLHDAPTEDFFKSHDFESDSEGRRYRKRDLTAPAHGDSPSGQYEWKGKRPPKGRMWSYTKANMERLEAEGRIVYTRTGMPRLVIYVDAPKGVPLQDVWSRPELWLNSAAKERVGYATQKPISLLKRLIGSSSNPGDVVLDPFCGCGSAILAAQDLGRKWIGIDIAYEAMMMIEARLKARFGDIRRKVDYKLEGIPSDPEAAKGLAKDNPYAFQAWAVSLIRGGQPHGSKADKAIKEAKKGKDRGLDGLIFFQVGRTETGFAIVSVKGTEKVGVQMIRDLRGTIEREKAPIGVFVSLAEPTKDMRDDAAEAGVVDIGGHNYRRIQMYTVTELLNGKRVDLPPVYDLSTLLALPKGGAARLQIAPPQELRRQINMMLPLRGGRNDAKPALFDDAELPVQEAPRRRGKAR
jgi:DNA modification methylase